MDIVEAEGRIIRLEERMSNVEKQTDKLPEIVEAITRMETTIKIHFTSQEEYRKEREQKEAGRQSLNVNKLLAVISLGSLIIAVLSVFWGRI